VRFPVAPLKHLAALPISNGVGEAAEFDDPDWPRYVRTTDIAGPRSLWDNTFRSLPPEVAKRASLKSGDLLMTAAGGVGKSTLYVSDNPACYAGYLVRFRPRNEVDGRFVAYWAESQHFWDQIEVGKVVSTIDNFSAGKYQNLRCPSPSLPAQRAIADYLDTETARIDALIAKKQRMTELLHEQVDAIIREEVLGAGQMTGPPWASSMGADRQLVRLGSVLRLRQERNDPIRVGQVLSLTAARGVIPYEEKGDIGNKASDDISRYSIVRVGDIVLNSMNVIIGSVGLSKYEGVLSPVYYVMMPVAEALVDRRFLAYHFKIREFQRQLIRLGYGILDHRMRIPWVNLKSQELALPSITEQRRVADLLDRVEDRHRALVRRLEAQIELLQEHRQALITAAVTGELEVPGVAA